MFYDKLKKKPTALDIEIEKLLAEMHLIATSHPTYAPKLEKLERLYKLKGTKPREPINPNTVLGAGTQLAGIAMIIRHEQLNVITTKALGFIPKLK